MVELNKIYCMDNLEFMRELPDESVDCIITSPPYCFGKEYNSDQNDLINSVFCFLADNYGNCSKDNYNRLIKNPELALQHSKEENSKYQFIDVKDMIYKAKTY